MDQSNKRSVSFLIISIVLHILLFIFFMNYKGIQFVDTQTKKQPEPSVTFLDISDVQDRLNGQIVEQDEQKSEKALKDAKFLSKNNKIVNKETRAAKRGEFKNKPGAQSQKPQQASQAVIQKSEKKPVDPEYEAFKAGDISVNKSKEDPFQALRPNSVANFAQSASTVSQNNDYIKDVEIGAETHLNTREFKYYTYFNRIKKRLRKYWEPMIQEKVEKLVRTGRNPANMGSKVTRLVITLDNKGILTRVQVRTTSGLEDLDDAAVDAFRAAAPFPNPPKDLIKDGIVQINWDFILES